MNDLFSYFADGASDKPKPTEREMDALMSIVGRMSSREMAYVIGWMSNGAPELAIEAVAASQVRDLSVIGDEPPAK